jgi:hypothetical protein
MELAETRTAVLADIVLDLDDLRSLLKLVKELTEWQGAEHWITSIRVTAPSGARFETSEYAVLDPGGRPFLILVDELKKAVSIPSQS